MFGRNVVVCGKQTRGESTCFAFDCLGCIESLVEIALAGEFGVLHTCARTTLWPMKISGTVPPGRGRSRLVSKPVSVCVYCYFVNKCPHTHIVRTPAYGYSCIVGGVHHLRG